MAEAGAPWQKQAAGAAIFGCFVALLRLRIVGVQIEKNHSVIGIDVEKTKAKVVWLRNKIELYVSILRPRDNDDTILGSVYCYEIVDPNFVYLFFIFSF